MSKANNLTEFLTDVADAIRYSAEKTETINPQSFSDEIKKLKLSEVPVSLTSGVMLSGDNLDRVRIKQNRLITAINGTVIDGETVYKITQQINDNDNSSIDTIFYTKEGDAGDYYYVLSSIDNFLNKIVPLITFTIAGTTYTAESGMTFETWMASEYNTSDFRKYEDDYRIWSKSLISVVAYNDSSSVSYTETIIPNYEYKTKRIGGGGSN